jgi:hypothetical protein
LFRLSQRSRVAGVALTAVLAVAGCGSSPSSGGTSQSGTSQSGTSQPGTNASFRQCMQQHGVTLPSGGFPGGGAGASPHPRPSGSRSASFQQAIKACGGGGFGGGGFGGNAG